MRFKFKNSDIHLHFTFAALILILIINDKSRYLLPAFLSSVAHEIAHIIALRSLKIPLKSVGFSLLGARFIRGKSVSSYKAEVLVSLSGPIINLILAILFFMLSKTGLISDTAANIAAVTNAGLAVINLLPFYQLDGGKALYSLVSEKLNEKLALRLVTVLSFVFAVPVTITGISVFFYDRGNSGLLIIGVYLFSLILFKKQDCP